jgi:hypothetical protein
MSKEIDNLIEMLEEDLEWAREQMTPANPNNVKEHKRIRIMLTLAKSIQELQNAH